MNTNHRTIVWPRLELPGNSSYLYEHTFEGSFERAKLEGGLEKRTVLRSQILEVSLVDFTGFPREAEAVMFSLVNQHNAIVLCLDTPEQRREAAVWFRRPEHYPVPGQRIAFQLSNPTTKTRLFQLALQTIEFLRH